MAQLRRGARQALDYLMADLDSIEDYAIDNPAAVRKLARRCKERLRDELEPMLQRPTNETAIESRLKALEAKVQELSASGNITRFRKAE